MLYIAGDQENECVKALVVKCEYQLVLFTPEMLLDKKRWRTMLLGDVYSARLRAFVVDVAHTVKKWSVISPVDCYVCIYMTE